MSKIVSPLLIRSKNVPNYLNKLHLKLNTSNKYLTYINFFKLLLNFIYLFKFKILNKYKLLNNKFVYLYCSYCDFFSFNISLFFYKLKYRFILYLYKNIIILSNYLNYFIKFNLYKTDSFIFIFIQKFKYDNKNIYHLITSIKNFLKFNKNFKKKITYFINSLLRPYRVTRKYKPIQGIKCIYSGCLYKNSKKRTFKYAKGKTSTTTITTNIAYAKKTLKTKRGIIGIKLWIYK